MEDPLPFASLSDNEIKLIRTPPPRYTPTRPTSSSSARNQRTRYIASPTTPSPFHRPRKLRYKSRSPSPTPVRRARPLPDLLLYGYEPETRRLQSDLRRSYRPPPEQSWLSYFFSPSWSLILLVTLPCIAIIYLCNLLQPLTAAIGGAVHRLTNFDPIAAVQATTAAFAAVPFGQIWCNSIGLGCAGPDRYAAYSTDSFESLSVPVEQISLGNDFFDCLNDLKITRQQKKSVAHLITLAPKVLRYERVLDKPEELSDNLLLLAKTRREIIMNANAARVTGRGTVGNIIQEFDHARYLSATRASDSVIQSRLQSTLSETNEELQSTSDHTFLTSEAIKSSEDISAKISKQIHREIARLKHMQDQSENIGWKWLEDALTDMQPIKRGLKDDREQAAGLLREVLKVVDEGAEVSISNSMSVKQCAMNIKGFKHQVEKAFTLVHDRLSMYQRLEHLSPSIEALEVRLIELKQSDLTPARPAKPSSGGDEVPAG